MVSQSQDRFLGDPKYLQLLDPETGSDANLGIPETIRSVYVLSNIDTFLLGVLDIATGHQQTLQPTKRVVP